MFVIVIGIIGYIGYKQMYGSAPTANGVSAPKQKLQNVQKAADRIEAQQQKSTDEALDKANGN